ncbi:Asp23/Gls24 family envelope stress response protein [Streptomyces sp. NPDC059828]|uniref:Asp23/Gls24 family envelope stress response protein n=1 Tax=Streptomyces sp. NPDC059828 TaxID=3346965 RepID=UPI00365B2FE8
MTTRPTPAAEAGPFQQAGTKTQRLPPPAERGVTEIPDKVVARIAARAAREALTRHVGPPSARPLTLPSASATVHEGSARLSLSLDLPYPLDIASAAGRMRQAISERVAHLTGMNVSEVTLTVRRLVPADDSGRRRVR